MTAPGTTLRDAIALAPLQLPTIALSVRQPWAWGLFHAGKNLENRGHMAIRSGGMRAGVTIAIHASQGMGKAEYEIAAATIEKIGRCKVPPPGELERGGIIGVVDVVDIVNKSLSPWFFGPKALVLANQRRVAFVPCAGVLGYFAWTRNDDVVAPRARWMDVWPDGARPRKPGLPHDGRGRTDLFSDD